MAYSMFMYILLSIYVFVLSVSATTYFMKATDMNGTNFPYGMGVVSPGESITIECVLKGNISWTRREIVNSMQEILKSNDKISIMENKLEIRNIKFADGGMYYCEYGGISYRFILYVYAITNSRNATAPTSIVHYEINGIKFSQLKLNEKDSVSVSCTCDSGKPATPVNIDWKGGLHKNEISNTYSNEISQNGSAVTNTLILQKPIGKKELYGPYICLCNAVSGAVKEARVYIKAPPIFEEHETSKRTTEGENVTLTCKVWGYPDIVTPVEWRFQNSTVLRPGIQVISNKSDPGSSKLLITQVTQADRGVYSCHAQNEVDVNMVGTMLRVKGRYAALWPFIGIVIQVIILAIIIIIYEVKKSHKSQNDSSKFNFDSKDQQDSAIAMKSSEVTDVRQRLMKD